MYFDTHCHTLEFSNDSHMSIDKLVSAASDLDGFCITDHYEIDNKDPRDNLHTFDLRIYQMYFDEWEQKYPYTKIRMGIEFGYQTHTASEIDETAYRLFFDQVILSNRRFRGIDIGLGCDETYAVDKKTRHTEYMLMMCRMAEEVINYDIIGHFDYISKFVADLDHKIMYDDCPHYFDELFEIIISKGKTLEINTATMAEFIRQGYYGDDALPDRKILERYRNMGGELISLGSDAHAASDVGRHFKEMAEYLKSLGFYEAVYYEGRKIRTYSL